MLGKLFSLGPGIESGPTSTPDFSSEPPPGNGAGPSGKSLFGGASNSIGILGHHHHETTLPRPVTSLESVQEDMYTRNLLFPNFTADNNFPFSNLSDPPTAFLAPGHPFDYGPDLDLDPSHVRVLILQDANSSLPAAAIFDSHPGPPDPTSSPNPSSLSGPYPSSVPSSVLGSVPIASSISATGQEHSAVGHAPAVPTSTSTSDPRRVPPVAPVVTTPRRARRPVRQPPESPQPRQGAFDRRASLQNRIQAETEAQRRYREHQDELRSFASCIFGNSELMAYKGTSTKVHIVPAAESRQEQRPLPELSSSYVGVGDRRGSIGRSSLRASRTPHSHSFSDTISPLQAAISSTASISPQNSNRQRIIISRLFPVVLPADDLEPDLTSARRRSEDPTSFPFPSITATGIEDPAATKKKKAHLRQKRIPMYAIALIVQLPPNSPTPPHVAAATHKNPFRGSGSFNDQESFASSYGSNTRRSAWSSNDPGDSPFSAIDVEDRIDTLTRHWDVIMRTLTHLQSRVTTILIPVLRHAALTSPDSFPPSGFVTRTPSAGRRGLDDNIKTPKPNKLVYLQAGFLQQDRSVAHEVDVSRTRIITGLAAARVVAGQGRWGIWRDEVRSLSRLHGPRDYDFFVRILNGFLATHTDWLQALSPALYRNHYALLQQRKSRADDDMALTSRTVIVSNDKMMARRLIFLLSSFLPSSHPVIASAATTPTAATTARIHRLSTSTSLGPFSNSPPTFYFPVGREECLRRKINRRPVPRQSSSHSRNASLGTARTSIVSVPAQLAHLTIDQDSSARTANPILSTGGTATPLPTTAVTPENTIPHFSTAHTSSALLGVGTGDFFTSLPGSTGSVAAEDLKRTLRRGESTSSVLTTTSSGDSRSQRQNQGSVWGSVISGLWGAAGKRRSLASITSPQINEGQPIPPLTPLSPATPGKTERGKSVAPETTGDGEHQVAISLPQNDGSGANPRGNSGQQTLRAPPLNEDRTPDPSGDFISPVKTSINLEDGVIDVDVPLPDFITSFETSVSSPSSSGFLSNSGFIGGLDSFELLSRLAQDGETPLNVAGWLPHFHPDFALQAIPPQDGLIEAIKAAMRDEPSPTPSGGGAESTRWVNISTTLVADAVTGTATRIRHWRLVRPTPRPQPYAPQPLPTEDIQSSGAPKTPFDITQPGEKFMEEQVLDLDLDKALSAAVDRVVAAPAASGEAGIPRDQCKAVVLSALEAIIKSTIEDIEKDTTSRGKPGAFVRQEGESVLFEAVRVWLQSLGRSSNE